MAQLQMLYSEWLDQDLVVRIQVKSPPTIFSLASLGFGGNLSQLVCVNISSIILRPAKYNKRTHYLESNNLLTENHHRFQAKRSTISAWAYIQQEWASNTNNNYIYIYIFEEIRLVGFEIYFLDEIWLFGEDIYFFCLIYVIVYPSSQ